MSSKDSDGEVCPPHLAVLDEADRLVCSLCGVTLSRRADCLGCIAGNEGWTPSPHTCGRAPYDQAPPFKIAFRDVDYEVDHQGGNLIRLSFPVRVF